MGRRGPNEVLGRAIVAITVAAAAVVAMGVAPSPAAASSYRIISVIEPGWAGNTHPEELVTGADGRVWFTETYFGESQIGSITPSGGVKHYGLAPSTWSSAIAQGPDGNIWAQIPGGFVRVAPPSLMQSCFCLPGYTGGGTDTGIVTLTVGPDGKMWYTRGTLVGRITLANPVPTIEEFPTPLTSAQLVGLAPGSDGAMWFVDAQSGTLGRVTMAGAVTTLAAPLLQGATDLVKGPDNSLWFSGAAGAGRVALNGTVTPIPGTANDDPEALAVSPAGDVWATGTDALLQIGPTGTVTRHQGGLVDVGPHDIAAGPDGYMWFTVDGAHDSLGKISWAPDPSGEFTGIAPARILDTRTGLGRGGVPGPLGSGETFGAQMTGRGGVPATGVSAVVMNVTVVDPTGAGYLTLWPSGDFRPEVSNLNFVPGQTVPNLVTVGVGPDGKVNVFNAIGSSHVLFDVVGYYADRFGPLGGRFQSLSPARLFDTRIGQGGVPARPVGPGEVLGVDVTGAAGVPATGVTGVVMNVTVTQPSAGGWLVVYPDDTGVPASSNLNFLAGQTVPNLVTVRVPPSGVVDFRNAAGTAHVLADVVGYYVDSDGVTSDEGRFVPVQPARMFDTRLPFEGPLEAGDVVAVGLAGEGGPIPGSAGAVALNATVTQPAGYGWVTVFPDDECSVPNTSNVNYVPGQTVPNMVVSRLSGDGGCGLGAGLVDVYTTTQTHLILDAFGYFTG